MNNIYKYNKILKDNRLKLQDVGLFFKIISVKKKYLSEYQLLELIPNLGRTALRSSIKRLESCGYLSRVQQHDLKGKFSYCAWIPSPMGNTY